MASHFEYPSSRLNCRIPKLAAARQIFVWRRLGAIPFCRCGTFAEKAKQNHNRIFAWCPGEATFSKSEDVQTCPLSAIVGTPFKAVRLQVSVAHLHRSFGIVAVLSLAGATAMMTIFSVPLRTSVNCRRCPIGVRPTLFRNCVALRIGLPSAAITTSPF